MRQLFASRCDECLRQGLNWLESECDGVKTEEQQFCRDLTVAGFLLRVRLNVGVFKKTFTLPMDNAA